MNLVGINGFRRSGKDTTYHRIKALSYGHETVHRAAFADKLKVMAALSIGYSGTNEELIAAMDKLKESGFVESRLGEIVYTIEGRRYLQNFGQHARKVFGDSFWVDQVLPEPSILGHQTKRELENGKNLSDRYPDVDWLAITDVRYPNEAERVLLLGGEVWEIIKPGLESDGHSSEQPLPRELVTTVIDNDGTIEELERKVAGVMADYGESRQFAARV